MAPSPRRVIARLLRAPLSFLFRHRAHIVIDSGVVALVLALPLGVLSGSTQSRAQEMPRPLVAPAIEPVARAQTASRGSITAARDPETVVAEGDKPIVHYTLSTQDTLASMSNYFGVSPEAIAFANGMKDFRIQVGREILIPPGEGALYTVQEGDTVESVASRFRVDPKAIMEYNRLYFEPEHFASDLLIFVPGATLPGIVYTSVDSRVVAPPVSQAIAPKAATVAGGKLSLPIRGRITQTFWALHSGVDIAAPYGSGVAAADDGIVIAAGWVPVGGLSVRIRHDSGIETGYYHLSAIYAEPGTAVTRGRIIGAIGLTGVTTGPHVHWEAKLNGRFVNPLQH